MSYYDEASLVVIPSGYKTSKVYAEKPTDGSGDLAFTRTGDTATRVNSAGLIEKVRTNLVLQSQTLSVSPTWTPYSGTTVTADAIAAPDGTLTADRIAGTSAAFRGIYQTISSSAVPHTFSVYLKSATGSATTARIWVDSGVSLVNVTTDWQRFSVTATTAASFDVQISTAVSSAIDVYAWGAQLEANDFGATPYILTTTAAVSTGPVANVPRLDYLGSTCPRFLLEPQRTNALLQSETLNSATWTKDGGSVTANAVASPDGYTNADLFTEDTSTGNHRVYQNSISTSANQPVTFSVFAKYNGRQYVYLRMDVVSPKTAVFDIQNGTAGTVSSGASSKIENYGNGWYRLILTVDALAGNAAVCEGLLGFLSGSSFSNASYTGNGTAGAYLWGFQGEANASYATSLIPTLAASATRGADACSKTGISSLIGQTQGTLFAEFKFNSTNFSKILLFASVAGSYANAIYIQTFSSNGVSMQVWSGGVSQVAIDFTGLTNGQTVKMAAAYKGNDFAFYVNGTQAGTDTSGTVPSGLSQIEVGSYAEAGAPFAFNEAVNQALLFKTRLTNAELAELTTL